MIVSTFKTGTGGASGPLNYLLKKHDRNPPAEVLKGDPKLLQVLIDSNHRKFKYSSGVIAFRDDENPTDEQISKVISGFEKTFTGGLGEERLPLLWVLHRDKGNTELHFIAPTQEAQTGKQFNICPPGKNFQQMFRDFQAVANHHFGWKQVGGNLLQSEFNRFDKLAGVKEKISSNVERLAEAGTIKNREDFLEFVTSRGFTITRTGKDYISLKHPSHSKAFRLKGGAFAEGADYGQLLKQSAPPETLSNEEFKEVMGRLERAKKNRREGLLLHFDGIPRTTKTPKQEAKEQEAKDKARAFFTISKPDVLQRMKAMEDARKATATADPPQSSKPKGFKL